MRRHVHSEFQIADAGPYALSDLEREDFVGYHEGDGRHVLLLQDRSNPTKMSIMLQRLRRHATRNDQVDWDQFDADAYCADNYRSLRDDDREIIALTAAFFAEATARSDPGTMSEWNAVDVGTGSNLYPAFSMLPFCASLELREHSSTLTAWLRNQVKQGYDDTWNVFWEAYSDNPRYADYGTAHDVRAEFQDRASVEEGSVFDLPRGRWDLGTMFFVACSLSTRRSEFRRAIQSFVGALRPGAPFAVAFMTNSDGYQVQNKWFPAVSVDVSEIDREFTNIAIDLTVKPISSYVPVRPGVGMALATGFAR